MQHRNILSTTAVLVILSILFFVASSALAVDTGNVIPQETEGMGAMAATASTPELPFDPNDHNFMIYDCGGSPSQNTIQNAMLEIGIENFTVCNASNSVTLAGLNSHDILIVGWSSDGNKGGLDPNIIEQGIIGQVILSGHDSDYHTVNRPYDHPDAAETFFIQEIDYILKGGGTGLIVCADIDSNFSWLPASWGINSSTVSGEIEVSSFTQAGLDSGIYDSLTPIKMSGWGQSYHNNFTQWGDDFVPFELGNENQHVVTIATTTNITGIVLEKNDGLDDANDLDCVGPDEYLTYTICWEEPNNLTLEDAKIIDYLPAEVSYLGEYLTTDPNTGMPCWVEDNNYDPNNHTYTWDIGTIYPYDANCVSLTVTVNERAEPGLKLRNEAELVTDDGIVWAWADEDTLVCCWDTVDPNIIYVDKAATGFNNGTNWDDAYVDLQDALYRAENSNCAETFTVYVAQGTYSPGYDAADTFSIPDGVKAVGGYRTGGGDWNPDRYETILTGVADPNDINNDVVVTMGNNSLLDGFTVTESLNYGVYGDGCDFDIVNCKIENNEEYGIYALYSDVTIKWCSIANNKYNGIYHAGDGFSITVENSQIKRNKRHGIFTDGSIPTVKNSIIASNGFYLFGFYGMRIENPAGNATLYNNTIVDNAIEGISFVDNGDIGGDPNGSDWPDIQNCIVYFNNESGDQMAGMYPDDVAEYSCIQDCNELNYNTNDFPGFAYTVEPNFVEPYPDNYHLAYDSVCVDAENPDLVTDSDAQDIDGEDREYGSSVDMGADEVYSCDEELTEDDIYNALDWNADGIVNYEEFEYFSLAWLSHDPNDPAWIADPNLADPDLSEDWYEWKYMCNLDDLGDSEYEIDFADLDIFVNDWLWTACWKQSNIDRVESMMMATGGAESMMVPMGFAMTEPEPEPAKLTEEQLIELVKGIYGIMSSLDESFLADELEEEKLDEFMDFFGSILLDLQEEYLEE